MRRLPALPSSLLIGLMTLFFVPQAGSYPRAYFQSTAILQGRVVDQNGAVVSHAQISAHNSATAIARAGESDSEGNYQIAALPVGNYRLEVKAGGFKTEVVERVSIEVARIVVQDFRLEVGDITQTVNVTPEAAPIDEATVSVGQVIGQRAVQELPLNGLKSRVEKDDLMPSKKSENWAAMLSGWTKPTGSRPQPQASRSKK